MSEQKKLKNNKHKQFGLGMLVLMAIWVIFSLVFSSSSLPSLSPDESDDINSLPNFSTYTDTQEKKQAFFDFLFPIAVNENLFLLEIRTQLTNLEQKNNLKALSNEELTWLSQLQADYLIESEDTEVVIQSLLKQIDIIPPSLILAQAAIESGWGTSRFAKKANNLFGHWCFSEGCGLIPKARSDGKVHEVAKFDSVNDSVRSYLKNLNSFHSYEKFRILRSQSAIKETGKGVLELVPGLGAYSEQGNLYIRKVTNMIKQNNLQRFDSIFIEQLNKI